MSKKGIIWIFLSLSIFVFLALTVGILIIFFLLSTEKTLSTQKPMKKYLMSHLRPQSKTKFGFATIPDSLNEEEYVSYYNDETKTSVVITNFGGQDFTCTGSCYCSLPETDERRAAAATGNLLTRGFVVLLSAFSISMATKIAKESFHHECEEQFSAICQEPHIILSETDDCVESDTQQSTSSSTESTEAQVGEEEEGKPKYLCTGYCVDYTKMGKEEFKGVLPMFDQEEYAKFGFKAIGLCESLTLDKEIVLTDNLRKMYPPDVSLPGTEEADRHLARSHFVYFSFQDFCWENSRIPKDSYPENCKLNEKLDQFISGVRVAMTNAPPGQEIDKGHFNALLSWSERGPPFCHPFQFEQHLVGENGELLANKGEFSNINCKKID